MYIKEPRQRFRKITKETKAPNYRIWFVVGLLCLLVYAGLRYSEVVEVDKNGNLQLTAQRLQKLHDDTIKFENAEQYVLYARISGYYACLSCLDTTHIYLSRGEVWKYGVTINGQKGRYSAEKLDNFIYFPQFKGTLQQCLIEERKKIITYPLLPENQARPLLNRIARPPGNPYDH
jgi:hypothetical protein